MKNAVRLIGLFLLAGMMPGQHSVGHLGGGGAGFAQAPGHLAPAAVVRKSGNSSHGRRALNSRLTGDVVGAYPSLIGDYSDDLSFEPYSQETRGFASQLDVPPFAEPMTNQIAHGVINEYKWGQESDISVNNSVTFTIVLTDGSREMALATWLQNGKLFYIDSEGRRAALPPSRIDRDITERVNKAKNLIIQLPPG